MTFYMSNDQEDFGFSVYDPFKCITLFSNLTVIVKSI